MRDFARRSEKDRRDVFRASAQAMNISEAIIEKDFWVCWVLDYLFQSSPWKDKMAFKGGTSLSKAYDAIERFSEDVDLILDWRLLGCSTDDLLKQRSRNEQDAFNKAANQQCEEFLAREFAPAVRQGLKGLVADIEVSVDKENPQGVLIRYPKAFELRAIRPEIILEIGPLAAWAPNEPKEIRPYSAEKYPEFFTKPSTTIPTVVAERTFWEKATILHQEFHRPVDKMLPPRYSRHYYDLYRLSRLPVRESAIKRLDLLKAVVIFKDKFYHSAWSKYETAEPGSLRLSPSGYHAAELARDYESMKPMLFGTIPSFDEILSGLASLEKEINSLP